MKKSISRRRFQTLAVALAGLLAYVPAAGAALAKTEGEEPETPALLTGTVFTEKGFSLPGVEITVRPKGEEEPRWEAVSDRRGEFAFRLPPGPATYEVETHSEERENETRTVKFEEQEKINIFFRLPPKDPEEKEE